MEEDVRVEGDEDIDGSGDTIKRLSSNKHIFIKKI